MTIANAELKLSQMTQTRIKKAVFPVGGLGTRFLPATKSMPKEMLTVIDKPLIQYAVEEARAAGIEEFIFITGRGKAVIEDHFDFSYELNAELKKKGDKKSAESIDEITIEPGKLCYVRQQAPLGLGHAVWCAREFINDEPFAVILADDFIIAKNPCLKQMIETYTTGNMVAILDVPQNETSKYGILDIKQGAPSTLLEAHSVVEKPTPGDAPSRKAIIGRYILDPKIFDFLGRHTLGTGGEIQLTDSLKEMLDQTPLYGLEFEGKRFDCGSKTGLLKANIAAAMHRPDMAASVREILSEYKFFKDNIS